ncbi:hypothetical protein T492DRAFT_918386 [Pavlovales sp. CCMP2436]|nr:hypothetical protein T492DRAFT_918386 [Pavlovales sp. CCMP2436]
MESTPAPHNVMPPVAIAVAVAAVADGRRVAVATATLVDPASTRPLAVLALATLVRPAREAAESDGEGEQLAREELLVASLVHAQVAALICAFVDVPAAMGSAVASPEPAPLRCTVFTAVAGSAAETKAMDKAALENVLRWVLACPLFATHEALANSALAGMLQRRHALLLLHTETQQLAEEEREEARSAAEGATAAEAKAKASTEAGPEERSDAAGGGAGGEAEAATEAGGGEADEAGEWRAASAKDIDAARYCP